MKRSIFIIIVLFIIAGCTKGKQETAEITIKEYLKTNLKDPKSYESVEFGILDSAFSELKDEVKYRILDESDLILKQAQNELLYSRIASTAEEANTHLENSSKLRYKADSMINELKLFTDNYKPYFIGYVISHKYRTNNEFGALDIVSQKFYIDSTLTQIMKVE